MSSVDSPHIPGKKIVSNYVNKIFPSLKYLYNYHLFTETEGSSVFCGPETVDVSRGEAEEI
jgi:hypothetical protein